MTPRRALRVLAAAAVALLGAGVAASGCEQIADFPDRAERDHIASCAGDTCSCVDGFGSCDGDLENGCELFLGESDEHCGACDHGCLGGKCANATCGDFLMFPAAEIAGPAIFGDRIFVVDELTGDLLASPLHGELDFQVIHSQPVKDDHFVNLSVAADGLYVILSDAKSVTVLRVDGAGAITEPAGPFPWTMHSDFEIAATTEALFYSDGPAVYRVDRATLQRTKISDDAEVHSLAARGEDVFFAEDDVMYTVRPVAQGGGSKESVFGSTSVRICRIVPLEAGFAIMPCSLSGRGLEHWDAQGNLLGRVEGDIFDAIENDGEFYFLEETLNGVHVWDGASPTSTVLTVTPFGFGTFKIARYDDALYWGSKNGVVRRRLPLPAPGSVTP